jgi:FdhD protein
LNVTGNASVDDRVCSAQNNSTLHGDTVEFNTRMRDTSSVRVLRVHEQAVEIVQDDIVVEEPLEIRVNNQSIGVTMRTPGDDFDLAVGFLWTEGLIRKLAEVGTIGYCADEEQSELKNVVTITLVDAARKLESSRKTWASSSCGLCGKATLESLRQSVQPNLSPIQISSEILDGLPAVMREHQRNFARTGGIHAAALFDISGTLLLIREDLGRHNAVDKVLGGALRCDLTEHAAILMVSGRLGFEIAQKAAVAGIPIVASVSAPSSLAIELASELGLTAVGFVRERSMNIYTHAQRVLNAVPEHHP